VSLYLLVHHALYHSLINCRISTSTKNLIEEYTREVVSQLEYVANSELTLQSIVEFFHDTKQSFGCSALVLYGGAAFGLYHLGVVKALNERGLLPRIISGTAIGALIAALVCINTDEELPVSVFESRKLMH